MRRMVAYGCLTLLLTGSVSYAMESWDTIVSLGDCQIKHQLKKHGIVAQDSPFDILDASFKSLSALIRKGFQGFLDRRTIRLHKDGYVYETKYGTLLVGPLIDILRMIDSVDVKQWLAGTDPYSTGFARIREILIDRAEVLLRIWRSDAQVLFFRRAITKEEAMELDELFQNFYPELSYTIVVIGDNPSYNDDWSLPRIRSFGLKFQESWCGDAAEWREVLKKLGLLSADI